jgi:hypothetical protein
MGISAAHHQEVECIYVANGSVDCQLKKYNKYHLPHTHVLLVDDGLLIFPKHEEM